MPEAQPLAAMRRDIDRRSQRLKQVLKNTNLRREFLGGVESDDKKIVREFVAQTNENALKTKPKVSLCLSIFAAYPSGE